VQRVQGQEQPPVLASRLGLPSALGCRQHTAVRGARVAAGPALERRIVVAGGEGTGQVELAREVGRAVDLLARRDRVGVIGELALESLRASVFAVQGEHVAARDRGGQGDAQRPAAAPRDADRGQRSRPLLTAMRSQSSRGIVGRLDRSSECLEDRQQRVRAGVPSVAFDVDVALLDAVLVGELVQGGL